LSALVALDLGCTEVHRNVVRIQSQRSRESAGAKNRGSIHNIAVGYQELRRIETEDGLSHVFDSVRPERV
jgi:hypothetical protein